MEAQAVERKPLEDLLLGRGRISPDDLRKVRLLQQERGERIERLLLDLGFISEDDLISLMSEHLGVPVIGRIISGLGHGRVRRRAERARRAGTSMKWSRIVAAVAPAWKNYPQESSRWIRAQAHRSIGPPGGRALSPTASAVPSLGSTPTCALHTSRSSEKPARGRRAGATTRIPE